MTLEEFIDKLDDARQEFDDDFCIPEASNIDVMIDPKSFLDDNGELLHGLQEPDISVHHFDKPTILL